MADPLAWMVSRNRLDRFLADRAVQAGACLHHGQEVKQLLVQRRGVLAITPSLQLRARGAIIADGVHSRLARMVRPPFRRCQMGICLTAEVPADEATIQRVCGGSIVIDYGRTSSGYMWLFPKKGCISAGLGQIGPGRGEMHRALDSYLRSEGLNRQGPMRGALIPLKGVSERIGADRLLLAGDAAGFVDAFTGEGIQFAIHSGLLAGQTFAQSARRGDFSWRFLQRYRDRCRQGFLSELQDSVRLTNLLYRWPESLLKTAVRREEAVGRYLTCLGREKGGYRRFSAWFALNFLRLWEQ